MRGAYCQCNISTVHYNKNSYSPAPPSNGLFNDWLSSPLAPSLAAICNAQNNAIYTYCTIKCHNWCNCVVALSNSLL